VASAPALETVAAAVLADGPTALIIDLSKVDFLWLARHVAVQEATPTVLGV
jgi:hypothetical protein